MNQLKSSHNLTERSFEFFESAGDKKDTGEIRQARTDLIFSIAASLISISISLAKIARTSETGFKIRN